MTSANSPPNSTSNFEEPLFERIYQNADATQHQLDRHQVNRIYGYIMNQVGMWLRTPVAATGSEASAALIPQNRLMNAFCSEAIRIIKEGKKMLCIPFR